MDTDGRSLVLILGDAFCVDSTDFCPVPVVCNVNNVRKSVRFGWLYIMNSDLVCVYLCVSGKRNRHSTRNSGQTNIKNE